jgi:two-component system, chemotaxis family, CheB/CheR fusion protein
MSSEARDTGGSPNLLEQLERADSQLALYARDLRRTIDAEKQRARQLAEANERLKSLDRLKTDFLTFISHELRTPLSIMAMVAEVDPQAKAEELAWQLDIIRNGYERLERFIERGLQYFSWKARDRVSQPERVDLAALVREAAARVSTRAGPELQLRVSGAAEPCFVQGSGPDLAEVVQILLDNAVKFSTKEKRVVVDLGRQGNRIALSVEDRGVGFLPELGRELFQPFTSADVMHHAKGTGLSLALAAAIVEAHAGAVRALSDGPGKGARFIVEVPVSQTPAAGR